MKYNSNNPEKNKLLNPKDKGSNTVYNMEHINSLLNSLSGDIFVPLTNDYLFKVILQADKNVLIGLVSLLNHFLIYNCRIAVSCKAEE